MSAERPAGRPRREKRGPASQRWRRRSARDARVVERNPALILLAMTNRQTTTTFVDVSTRAFVESRWPGVIPMPASTARRTRLVDVLF